MNLLVNCIRSTIINELSTLGKLHFMKKKHVCDTYKMHKFKKIRRLQQLPQFSVKYHEIAVDFSDFLTSIINHISHLLNYNLSS